MYDVKNTLLLLLGLGLLLVVIQGKFRWICQDESDAIQCDATNPCSVGLKCINGFCAKTERVAPRHADADADAEAVDAEAAGPQAPLI